MTTKIKKDKDKLLCERKRQLYKLIVARSDIHAAYKACELLLNKVKDVEGTGIEKIKKLGQDYVPLLNAIIVCYGRPFSNNKPLGPLPSKWHKFSDPKAKDIHNDLLRMRDKMIAHSDSSYRPVTVMTPGYPLPAALGNKQSSRVSVMIEMEYLLPSYFSYVHAITWDLVNRLNHEIDKESDELFGQLPPIKFNLLEDIKL